jgi:redox-sensing transcriptional repressor
MPDTPERARQLPAASVERLPSYLRALADLAARGVEGTSSAELAELSGVGPAQLRRDLSYLGSNGRRGVGYDVAYLYGRVRAALGVAEERRIAIVGAGHLGHALANYSGFASRGFVVSLLMDIDPQLIGTQISGIEVGDVACARELLASHGVSIVVLATPGSHAQEVCDVVVAAGVREILNFAPCTLQVPDGVKVRSVDVGSELQILAFHSQGRAEE